jgi:hypothetical protein
MAYTTSFLVKNQGVGQHFVHQVRVTADAASGAFESGFNVVDFIQHSPQSATSSAYRVFMNANSGLTANNGSIALSGLASGDVVYMTVYGH